MTTIIISAITAVLWVWMGVIKFQERRGWHSYGCLILAASYALLIWIDLDVYKSPDNPVIIHNYLKVYFAYLFQLGAVISFLIFTYTKDHNSLKI